MCTGMNESFGLGIGNVTGSLQGNKHTHTHTQHTQHTHTTHTHAHAHAHTHTPHTHTTHTHTHVHSKHCMTFTVNEASHCIQIKNGEVAGIISKGHTQWLDRR